MTTTPRAVSLVLIAVLLCCSACANSTPGAQLSATQASRPEAASPLALPAPRALDRPAGGNAAPAQPKQTAAIDPSLVQYGSNFVDSLPSNRVVASGDYLTFAAAAQPGGPASNLAYAVYAFETPDPLRQPELRAIWDSPPAGANHVYLGVANQQRNLWEWYRGSAESSGGVTRHKVTLSAWTPYLSGGSGRVYVAVLVTGSEFASLRKLRAGEPFTTPASFDPPNGLPPFTVTGDNSLMEIVGGGAIVNQDVDYDEDGIADASGPAGYSGGSHSYTTPGTKTIRTTLTDDDGLSASYDSTVLAVEGVWDKLVVATSKNADTSVFWPNCGEVDGRPALAYLEYDTSSLDGDPEKYSIQYMIAAQWPGTEWLGPVTAYQFDTFDKPAAIGGIIDCAGKPGIFFRSEEGNLNFVRGDSAEGGNWTVPLYMDQDLTVDSGITVGSVEGRPAVACNAPLPFIGWYCWWRVADSATADGVWSSTLVGPGKGDIALYAPGYSNPIIAVHVAEFQTPVGHDNGGIYFHQALSLSGESESELWTQKAIAYEGFGVQGSGPVFTPTVDADVYSFACRDTAIPASTVRGTVNLATGSSNLPSIISFNDSYYDLSPKVLNFSAAYCFYESDDPHLAPQDVFTRLALVVYPKPGEPYPSPSFYNVDGAGNVGNHCSITAPGGLPLLCYEDVTNRTIKVAVLH